MIRPGSIAEAWHVLQAIPEFDQRRSLAQLQERLPASALVLIAEADGQPVGCKLGYAAEDGSLYSWLGGVLPAHRKTGLAQMLLEAQEAWASAHGFAAVTVKSMNRYPAMLRLLIRNGYQVRLVEHFGDPARERIHFIRLLSRNAS
ncbi:GNAT family N-acetyltransferase [Janthinobacterium lividum]|uniref:GNAT family N-acetyltransferase n=1 Tax=Janthinobacterium lividum TaxID=29581 RepID=UPI0008747F3E|nr:GNAT family N-acetyltransferase [Janthinobacterium lividum]MCC7713359.1 GNAT family N-acetyltransferase [Janthinobacterium lividum]OEZ61178.1 putative acetyltransferase [Janthinobacterium lividum]WQE26427.1 GNAT family N-acetyltransferase [Janthinobacterium lividum]STQ97320.1 putative acetyltransferase [Janthinobacterium lividum]